jgi:hypothetical protein
VRSARWPPMATPAGQRPVTVADVRAVGGCNG